jgi:acyl-CoA dehydrogenase
MTATAPELGAYLSAHRRIAQEIAARHASSVDAEARFPIEAISALREAGALGALVPEAAGGPAIPLRAVAQGCYELARACSATAMIVAMHHIQVGTLARHLNGEEWFTDYLRAVAGEQRLIASATSELGTGGDIGRSIAAIRPHPEGGLCFEKQAPTVSYGAHADDLLSTVRRSETAEQNDQVLVLTRSGQAEMDLVGTWDTLGMRGTCSPGFTVRARFAREQVLGAPFSQVMGESMVPISHILWSHVWLGIATEAFERGRSFVRSAAKRSGGQPVPAAHSLSRVMSELTMLRAEVRSGLADFLSWSDEPERERLRTMGSILRFNNLKLAASEQAPRICASVLEVIGIVGYKNDSPYGVGRQLRDSLSARLMVANERIHSVDASLLMLAKEL